MDQGHSDRSGFGVKGGGVVGPLCLLPSSVLSLATPCAVLTQQERPHWVLPPSLRILDSQPGCTQKKLRNPDLGLKAWFK
jgi:hypothetical protein